MIWGDYHTHSVFSHGKATIEQIVIRAVKLGLKEIAVTDHGFRHFAYNVRRIDWPLICKEVVFLRKKYPQIKLLLGLETNFNSFDGSLDIKPYDSRVLDVTLAGYHKLVLPGKMSDIFKFFIPNFWASTRNKFSAKSIARNTDAYLKGIEAYDIDIITHPNYGIKVDIAEVAKACTHFGTFFELNGRRIKMSDNELESAADTGVTFILNSDAHDLGRIANVELPLTAIKRVGIPYDKIANWDKLPDFRSKKKKTNTIDIIREPFKLFRT